MPFRRGGAGKRRDAIEPEVIQALRARGVYVLQLNGRATPDLLTEHRGRWVPLGVKSGEKAALTTAERAAPSRWPMVHSVKEALGMFGW
jgi:hypothetical protein